MSLFFGYNTGKSILTDTDMKHKFITILLDRGCLAVLQQYHQLGGFNRQGRGKLKTNPLAQCRKYFNVKRGTGKMLQKKDYIQGCSVISRLLHCMRPYI